MKPEVICTQIVTTGADINAVMAFALVTIGCIAALAWVSPQVAHWIALHIEAHAQAVEARRIAGMKAKRDFLALNRQPQE